MNPELLESYLERLQRRPAAKGITGSRRIPGDRWPASFAQRHVWLHARLAPEQPVYNEPITIHRLGALDVEALERSLTEVLRRHEAWRTTFTVDDGELMAVLHPVPEVRLAVDDLRALPPPEREPEALRLATADARAPFDLESGPLLRMRLVRLHDEEHRLFLTLHHVIFDGVSIYRILLPELTALYEAFAAGRPSPLPEPSVQYGDYAAWQRTWVESDAAKAQLAYWQRHLGGSPPDLPLPTDRPRPFPQTFAGAMERLTMPRALVDALKALAQREGVTFYMTMLAAFVAMLHRYSGVDEVTLGTVTAGRERPEVQGLLGYFLNPLALRLSCAGDPIFTEVLRRVRDTVLDALAHDEVPFERVVAAVQPQRDPARNPLFQAMFSLEPPLPPLPAGWRLTQLDVEVGTAKTDLYLELDDQPDGVVGRFVYRTDLFDAATVRRMVDHYLTLLDGVVADPGRPVSRLPLLTAPERRRVVVEWNATERSYPAEATMHAMFEAQALRAANRVAVTQQGRHLTYGELDARANAIAHRLRGLGVGPDRLVGVALDRSPDMMIALLGVLKAGGAYVPLDPTYPRELLDFMVDDADVAAVLTQRRFLERLPATRRPTLCLDADADWPGRFATRPPPVPVTSQHLAYAIYTSGSTGRPKGVSVPHRAVMRLLFWPDYVDVGPDEVVLETSSPSFDVAVFEMWLPLLHGGRLVFGTERVPTPATLRELIRREGVTMLWLTTSLFNAVVDAAPDALRGVRQLLVGGEALSVPHVRRAAEALPGTQLVNGYGPTETCVFACAYRIPGPPPPGATSIPIGRPIPNTRVYVLDRHGEPMPIGVTGELHIGGCGVARSYLNRPELTAEKFVPDPFGAPGDRLYKTGDLARWRPDGTVDYVGRVDAQVKVRGFRVEPGEIEVVLARHPGVRRAAVVARETAGARTLVAYVVPRPGMRPDPDDLRRHLAARLPSHMIPSAFVTLDELPLSGSGKLDRRALPAPDAAPQQRVLVAPRDPLEADLARMWEQLLGVGPVGVTDGFFDLGGHSLLAVRLVQRIEDRYGRRLPVAALYAHQTIEALAAALIGAETVARPIVPLNTAGTRRPLFFFHGDLSGGGFYCLTLARHLGADQPLYVVHPLGLQGGDVPATIRAMADAHVAELRRLQPRGPYRLGGYCNGGMVAFEVARRLERLGERVQVLALIASAPDPRLRRLGAAIDALPARPLRERGGVWLRHGRCVLDDLHAASPAGRSRVLLAAARRLARVDGTATSGVSVPVASAYRSLYDRYFAAIKAYVPRPCAAPLLVFWPSAEPRPPVDDGVLGWSRVARAVVVEVLPGDHNSIVTEHAATIARRLAQSLG